MIMEIMEQIHSFTLPLSEIEAIIEPEIAKSHATTITYCDIYSLETSPNYILNIQYVTEEEGIMRIYTLQRIITARIFGLIEAILGESIVLEKDGKYPDCVNIV